MELENIVGAENIRLKDDGSAVIIIDQTLLPNECVFLTLDKPEELYDAIKQLRVRGAPAIGIFAAYAIYVLAEKYPECDGDEFFARFKTDCEYLNSSRPTAVNLSAMLRRMCAVAEDNIALPRRELLAALRAEAEAIHREDMDMCRAIAQYALTVVNPGDTVLTYCNAGPLATSRYGTAQGPYYLAKETGFDLKAICCETRPLLQGARLTSYELTLAGVDCTLICDNMASIVMKQGKVQACFVGCDRVAANGDAANKIGTSGVAILAKHYGIPFYVLGPSTTIDFNCPTGDQIEIELRDPEEIKEKFYEKSMALPQVKCYNPAFDVTDSSLISGIITERGIARAPYRESLKAMFPEV
ncbi:MAG: S-methyl-5-thioribose-1-phosphate isomerase [Oscillospiraceae bacterium]|nr:S-methyl-5-thioribose-1-phosphate isomerase [Oscillospiraceae bacterium]